MEITLKHILKNDVRYPFFVTDSEGEILFSSPRGLASGNIFSEKLFYGEDIRFIKKEIADDAYERIFALKSRGDGNTVFISTALYPSARVYIVFYTEIPYKAAIQLCSVSSVRVDVREECHGEPNAAAEKYYPAFMKMISDISLMFSSSAMGDAKDFSRFLCERTRAVSALAFCSVNSDAVRDIPCSFNFDSSVFSLFILLAFSYFSEISKTRGARLCATVKDEKPEIAVSVPNEDVRAMTASEIEDIKKRFEPLLSHMRGIRDRLDLAYSFTLDGEPEAKIIPCRPEASLSGLKVPVGELLKEEKQE